MRNNENLKEIKSTEIAFTIMRIENVFLRDKYFRMEDLKTFYESYYQ